MDAAGGEVFADKDALQEVNIGLHSLDVRARARSFFHDVIVFAALDAVNDPNKNPTLANITIDGLH